MKILAFVDTHGEKKAIKEIIRKAKKEDPDLLICAGDLATWGENIEGVLKEFEKLDKILLFIPGNHEESNDFKKICKKLKFVVYFHQGSYKLGNYLFFGYGGMGFAQIDRRFEKISEKFRKTIKKDDKVVLVTHAPVYRTKTDKLYGEHLGNKSIRKFIEKTKVELCICGHFHETEKEVDYIGKTKIVNPGKSGMIIKI